MATKKPAEHVYVYAASEAVPPALPRAAMPDGARPHTLEVGQNVWLIVSTVPAAVYNAASVESRLSDLDWVSTAGAAHHVVVDAVAEAGVAVLPFRLFTIFSTEEQALTSIREHLPAIRRTFDRVRDRQEWVLRIGKPDPARRERSEAAAAASSGTSFLAAKAAARREEAERIERVTADAVTAYERLERLAERAVTKPVEPAGQLILDAAFLVLPPRVDELKQALSTAAQRLLRDGCAVSLTGPWPPYSFASLDTISNG